MKDELKVGDRVIITRILPGHTGVVVRLDQYGKVDVKLDDTGNVAQFRREQVEKR